MIKLDIVAIEGRTLEGVKFLGMIPEAVESEDFNVYVRWDGTRVSADRSDTDRNLVAAHVTKTVGKVEALKDLFTRLATLYGVAVTVQADPGVKVSALASKVLGTYGPRDLTPVKAITSADVDAPVTPVTPVADGEDYSLDACDEAEAIIPTNAEVDALMAEHDAAMAAWAASLVEALTVRTPGTLYTLAMAEAEIAESLGDAWHGTDTCVNCGCDPQVPVYTLNRGFRFPMGKRARKQVKRNKRTRVGA